MISQTVRTVAGPGVAGVASGGRDQHVTSTPPGAIQPHGVLVAVDERDARVMMVSANVERMLGRPVDDVIGVELEELLGPVVAQAVLGRMNEGYPREELVLTLDQLGVDGGVDGGFGGRASGRVGELAGALVDVVVHRSGRNAVIEIEPIQHTGTTPMTYQSARNAMSRLGGTGSVLSLCDQLAFEVRRLTGFDRVLVHRFDDDRHGEVVAEDQRADLDPLLASHCPATDIAAQARGRHTGNWLRLIADIAYVPVPLIPSLDPGTGAPLDLSQASLRSVSSIHADDLSDVFVTASMSVSLVIEGELWGLIACHHYAGPHRPPHDARSAAEFLAHIASPMIADRERADDREKALAIQTMLAEMMARISASPGTPLDVLITDESVLPIVGATGAVLRFDSEIHTVGDVVSHEDLVSIAAALDDPERYVTHTSHLSGVAPEFTPLAPVVSGVLRIGSSPDRWLMWLRPELEQGRQGAGHSEPWSPWETEAVDVLGRHMNGLLLLRSREQIAMAESLQRTVVLDRAPHFDGVELVARYRPATTYQLGGDWWDAFKLPDGRLALVVGDVAGHGVSAASAMTQVRTALRAYLFEGHPPADCLDHLDRLMDGLLDLRVATAIVAVLDVATGRVEIANAGHLPPLLVGPGGAAEELVGSARPLLGVGEGTSSSTYVDLPVGSTLLLYTDGLVERRGTDMDARSERLRALAALTSPGESLDDWADRLLSIQDGTEDDDTTLLAFRRT